MTATAWAALIGAIATAASGILGVAVGRRGRDASAAEALTKTVEALGTRVTGLYGDLHSAWLRAAAAESRAAAAEARAGQAEVELAHLRAEVARLSAQVGQA
jgi:hypothetical protein